MQRIESMSPSLWLKRLSRQPIQGNLIDENMSQIDKNWTEFSESQNMIKNDKTIFNIISSKTILETWSMGEKKMVLKYISGLFPFKLYSEHIHKEIYKYLISRPIISDSLIIKSWEKPNLSIFIVFKGEVKHFHEIVKPKWNQQEM